MVEYFVDTQHIVQAFTHGDELISTLQVNQYLLHRTLLNLRQYHFFIASNACRVRCDTLSLLVLGWALVLLDEFQPFCIEEIPAVLLLAVAVLPKYHLDLVRSRCVWALVTPHTMSTMSASWAMSELSRKSSMVGCFFGSILRTWHIRIITAHT